MSVEEVFGLSHSFTHPRGPLHDLGADVSQECVGGPSAQDHDFVDRLVGKEESHGCPGAKRVGANFLVFVPDFLLAESDRGSAEEKTCIFLGDEAVLESRRQLGRVEEVVDGGGGGSVGAGNDAGDDTGPGDDGAKDGITGALLGAGLHLLVVLLIFKGDGDELSN